MKPVLVQRRPTPLPERLEAVLMVRSGGTPRDADSARRALPPQAYALGYLCTGTALAILGQVVIDQGAVDPSTQLVAWTKYACTFVLSLALQLLSRTRRQGSSGRGGASDSGEPPGPPTSESSKCKAAWLTVAIG
ncbi:hypothetical protein TSOC_005354 [Tetrabaena socialis]|uniref:Uncharacterized protein n=1 Tax=Tetrabaena socialis TaxID=47790 RepID=A0A2J8A6G5_9CHLO|nr:hypothetical protein TSOC_005354 [Tetrabaena socialis]|eukprot:PNH08116.1 hypothetical protein TSOC_005354 [Tetrabaena socialis]